MCRLTWRWESFFPLTLPSCLWQPKWHGLLVVRQMLEDSSVVRCGVWRQHHGQSREAMQLFQTELHSLFFQRQGLGQHNAEMLTGMTPALSPIRWHLYCWCIICGCRCMDSCHLQVFCLCVWFILFWCIPSSTLSEVISRNVMSYHIAHGIDRLYYHSDALQWHSG